jgi:hypothetical protein
MATSSIASPISDATIPSTTPAVAPAAASAPIAAATPPLPTVTSTPSTGTMPQALQIALKVSFTLNTTDGLRQISFGLEKDTDGVSTDWTITFVLYERTDPTVDFGNAVVSLTVFVASPLQANAETAAHSGLTPAQAAHAIGPAADAAKAVSTGDLPLPVGSDIIQGTLA